LLDSFRPGADRDENKRKKHQDSLDISITG